MAVSALGVGEARLGWLVDGTDDTPLVSVMLQRHANDLVLTVPWHGHDSPYERWFGQGIRWGDDLDRTHFQYDPPEILWFVDPKGSISLVDCYARGSSRRLGGGVGQGTIGVRMAVLGGGVSQDYRRLNGMQTVVPGLGLWMRQRSLDRSAKHDSDGRLAALSLTWQRAEPTSIARRLNLSLHRAFEFQDVVSGDQALLEDQFYIQTQVAHPRSWLDHLDAHVAVRDLVRVASWQPFGFSHVSVTRDLDPLKMADGSTRGRQWLRAQVFVHAQDESVLRQPWFLFTFPEVGPAGVRRWLTLRDRYRRTIQPLVASLNQQRVPVETHLLQIGAAVEALGYELLRESGCSLKSAADRPFVGKAGHVLEALGSDIGNSLSSWPQQLHVTYRGLKHADRSLPSAEDALRLLETSRTVLRLWVASRVGIRQRDLQRRAERALHQFGAAL